MVKAIYPGSFDPVHNGHIDIANRASELFERVVIAVYDSPPKNVLFSTEKRVAMIRDCISDLHNVEVTSFSNLATDFAKQVGAKFIVRGLRAGYDFEYESNPKQKWKGPRFMKETRKNPLNYKYKPQEPKKYHYDPLISAIQQL